MCLGFPPDETWYKLFTDWGSLFSGVLALIAGILAYSVGVMQANAAKSSAKLQIDAINQQAKNEIVNVCEAVRIEITTYSKYVIGTLEMCEKIAHSEICVPIKAANYIAKMLYDSVVYPAVADRIGVLTNPQATVEFYMRISEAKASISVLATKADQPSSEKVPDYPEIVKREHILAVADSLITALQLAGPIIAQETLSKSKYDLPVKMKTLSDIATALASARRTFPEAESFKDIPE